MKKLNYQLHQKLLILLIFSLSLSNMAKASKTSLSTLTASAFTTAVTGITSGDTIVLTSTGTYDWTPSSSYTFTKSVTIMASSTLTIKPIIKLTNNFTVNYTSTLNKIEFIGVEFYCLGTTETTDSKYFLDARLTTGALTTLKLKRCYFHGFSRSLIRSDANTPTANITNLLVDSCTFNDLSIGAASYSIFGLKGAIISKFSISNSTFFNSPSGLIYYGATNTITFNMEKCNIIECGSYSTMLSTSSLSNPNYLIHFANTADNSSVFQIKDCIIVGKYTNSLSRTLVSGSTACAEKNYIYINGGTSSNKNLINTVMLDNTIYTSASTTFGGTVSQLAATSASYSYANKTIETNPYYPSIGDPNWWKVHAVSINESYLPLSGTIQLTATISPSDAPNKAITWSLRSEDALWATITSSGLITTKGSSGDVVVTATPTSNTSKATSKTLQISLPATGLSINETGSLNKGSSRILTLTTEPEFANPSAIWSVDNSSIATINASTGELTGVNKGFVVVTATSSDNSEVTTSATIEIIKGISVITWAQPSSIYVGTPLGSTQLNASVNGTSAIAQYTPSSGTILPLGTHNLTVSYAEDEDYTEASKTVSIDVVLKPSSISWNTPSAITYGTPLSNEQLNASITGSTGAITYSRASGTILNTGINYITVNVEPDGFCLGASKTISLVVNKAVLTAKVDNLTKVYGQTNPSFNISYTGFVNNENETVIDTKASATTTASTLSDADNYPITVSGASDNNYDFIYVSATLTITKADPSISWSTPAAIDYGTALSNAQLNATSISNSTAIYTPASGVLNAGNQTLQVEFAESTNYSAGSKTVNLVVNKVRLTVSSVSETRIYGEPNPSLHVNYSGFVNNESEEVIDTKANAKTSATLLSDVGTYAIVISDGNDENYDFVYVPATLTITKAQVNASVLSASKNYGTPNPSFSINYTGLKNGDDENAIDIKAIASTKASTSSKVGLYTISVGGASDKNYDFVYVSATLTISKSLLTASASLISKIYGLAMPTLTISYTGFTNDEDESVIDTKATASTAATSASNVGTYAINIGGASDNNYDFVYVPSSLTITKVPLTVTVSSITKVYGAEIPSYKIIYSGFVNGETTAVLDTKASISTNATASSKVGSYGITISGASDNNYSFVYKSATLTITKATLMIAANDTSVQKDKALPAFAYSIISGLVNGESATNAFSGKPGLTADITNAKVGDTVSIKISAGTLSSDNYDFILINGVLTITQNLKTASLLSDAVNLYPNPATSGNVVIKLQNNKKASVTLISLKGVVLLSKVLDSSIGEINIDDLPSGTYYIRIANENGVVMKTFVKQ